MSFDIALLARHRSGRRESFVVQSQEGIKHSIVPPA
jgi:hypothetical protein